MVNILLLREPSDPPPDRYEAAFTNAGYKPVSIPVLETIHTNLETLRSLINDGPSAQGVSGVVITSKRSCDAWGEALKLLQSGARAGPEVEKWSDVPCYVVGESTASAVRAVYSNSGLKPPDVRGQDSGNAAALGPFILDDVKERPARLLYLTGDKNRDTLPRIVEKGGLTLLTQQVYMTQGSSTFRSTLDSKLKQVDNDDWWIIYFAPSAADFATLILQELFRQDEEMRGVHRTYWNGAIGPTTHTFLRDTLGIPVHAVAQKPTPEDIVTAVREFNI